VAAVVAAVGSFGACTGDDPSRVGRPPVVSSFTPPDRQLTAFLGDTLTFRLNAFDPDRDPLTMSFVVDGGAVSSASRWEYVIEDSGLVTVRGSVSDGEHSSFVEWTVSRLKPVNLPPVVDALLPVEDNPVMVIGNRLDFAIRATDPEAQPLHYWFSVDDSLVVEDRQFTYHATSTGFKSIRAVVSDGERGIARHWTLKVTAVPDTIAPATVNVVRAVPGASPGEIEIDWVAVGRDGDQGLASQYLVRTAPEPILTEADWARGSQRPQVPPPAPPGTTMTMVVSGLLPARLTYVAVRAVDDFGNISPLGTSPGVMTRGMSFSGLVIDAYSRAGVAGAVVALSLDEEVTDAAGAYRFAEVGPVTATIVGRDESGPGIGQYYNYSTSYTVLHDDVVNFYLLPNYDLATGQYADFMQFFRAMTDFVGNPYPAQQRRFQLPVDLYVRPYARDGLDYRATIEAVAHEFDALLGAPVFNLVTVPPALGVETIYRDGLAQDNYRVTEFTNEWYPRLGSIQFRTVYSAATTAVLARTARHELGHALGLNHSLDSQHLMVGGQAPVVDAFTPDEIAVLRSFYGIPRGWDNRLFVRD
jgi:hypothetical protein